MHQPQPSSERELKAAIRSYNPFAQAGIVQEYDVWVKGFLDAPSLNAHASNQVFSAIEQVKNNSSSGGKVATLTIIGEAGVGKSHLIARIRHRLKASGDALFIYSNVNKYSDLNLATYQFQQTVADSFKQNGNQDVMQWQEMAASLVNGTNLLTDRLSAQRLVDCYDSAYQNRSPNRKNLTTEFQQAVIQGYPDSDPDITKAILWTLSQRYSAYAIKWLAGRELDRKSANLLGLPSGANKTNQDRESEAFGTLLSILNLTSCYKPILICFDEIDSIRDISEDGFTAPQIIASLVKRLHDALPQPERSRGVVIITTMFEDTWLRQVRPMDRAVADRMSTYTNGVPITLKYPNAATTVELVSAWLQKFYNSRQLTPPNPVCPFDEAALRELGATRPTVREILRWCAERFQVETEAELVSVPMDYRSLKFSQALESARALAVCNSLEDNQAIANALRLGFKMLIGERLEGRTSTGRYLNGVVVENIVPVEPSQQNKGYINFKILGRNREGQLKIGVAVVQQSHPATVNAAMKRLIDYQSFDLTRGCLVRNKPITGQIGRQHLEILTQERNGQWIELGVEEVQPLLAVFQVYPQCNFASSSQGEIFGLTTSEARYANDLTQDEVERYAKQIALENPLLREILSDSSPS